jgi:endonuclease/exonuclease/phosphatase family metal-dependent hydrolase
MKPDILSKRAEFADEAYEIREQIERLEDRLAGVQKKIAAINEVLAMFPEEDTEDEARELNTVKTVAEWVQDILRETPGQWYGTRQIGEAMQSKGYIPTSENFFVIVSNTCIRLAEKGLVSVDETGTKKMYCIFLDKESPVTNS